MALPTVETSTGLPWMQDLAGDLAAVGPAEDAHGELGAPRPHQPGDADDLALADVEVDAVDHLPVGVDRGDGRPSPSPRTAPRRSSACALG